MKQPSRLFGNHQILKALLGAGEREIALSGQRLNALNPVGSGANLPCGLGINDVALGLDLSML